MMKSYKGRTVELGTVVDIYRNLNQSGYYSIRDAKSGLVLAHSESVCVKQGVFKVSEAGRKKTLEMKRKRVHAYIRGILHSVDQTVPDGLETVYYNPYETKKFLNTEQDCFIDFAEEVHCAGKFAYVRNSL